MIKTIKGKIIVSFVILMLLMLGGQVVFNLFFSKTYFVEQSKKQLEELFDTIEESYSDDETILYELTESAVSVNGDYIQIFSEDGLIYSSRNTVEQIPGIAGGVSDESRTRINFEEYSEDPETVEIQIPEEGQSMLMLHGVIDYDGENRYVLISTPVEAIENSIAMFTFSSVVISCFILFFGIIVIVMIAREITKPIRNIELVSKKMSMLDFSLSADEDTGIIELSNLAESINSMSQQLQVSISSLQQANDKLQHDVDTQKQLDEMRRHFVANVSHEMKTPLALLQIYCENLKNNIDGIDKDEYCDIIIEETGRLDRMVKDMLNVSTIENGLEQMDYEKVNLSELTEILMNTLAPILQPYQVVMEVQPNLYISGDLKHIEQAMRNYLMNAVSHTKENEEIYVSLYGEKGEVVFSVYNQGEKIEESDLRHIWESFYKSDKSRTRKIGKNAGLGLHIVKVIIEKHMGHYGTNNKEQGVEFWFSFTQI